MVSGRISRWFALATNKRKAKRHSHPGLVAYYWDGSLPVGHVVKNISQTRAYVETNERWYVGTWLILTLQLGQENAEATACAMVPCQVVRHGSNGAGLNFMLTTKEEQQAVRKLVRDASRREKRGQAGTATVEFALMVPLVFLLLVNAFNFGAFIYCWLTVSDAARAAADYASLDTSTANAPATPSVSQLTSMVQSATAGLPNYSSSNPTVTACLYNNGLTTTFQTTSACPNGVTAPPPDPELIASGATSSYSTVAVDVTYTFTPLLAGNTFMRFGLPSLPSTIHRRMVVRWP